VREVEVKFRVRDAESLQAALKAQGIAPGEPIHQDDQAYAPVGWRFGDSKLGVSFVRLRTVNGRHFFTLKQPRENAQSCLEYETEVADREQMHHAIVHMGFYPTVRVAKTRRTAKVGDITLCVDDLDGVGTFLELERMIPADAPVIEAQRQLAAFVAGLGIDAEHTDETYDSLVRAAQG